MKKTLFVPIYCLTQEDDIERRLYQETDPRVVECLYVCGHPNYDLKPDEVIICALGFPESYWKINNQAIIELDAPDYFKQHLEFCEFVKTIPKDLIKSKFCHIGLSLMTEELMLKYSIVALRYFDSITPRLQECWYSPEFIRDVKILFANKEYESRRSKCV